MRARPLLAVLAVASVAGLAIAQQASKSRPVLHEDLPEPTTDRANPMIGGDGSSMPVAIRSGDKVLPVPTEDKSRTGEPVFGAGGSRAADRKTSIEMDSPTGKDGTLTYESVFQPDVVPFKRMTVLDAVDEDFKMVRKNSALVEVPVTNERIDATKDDSFVGFMLVQFERDKDIPIPSVSPDMRIARVKLTPPLRVKFEKDGADNFYIRSEEPSASGKYRLEMTVVAAPSYFAPRFPKGNYTPQIIATMAPLGIRAQLPARVKAEAQKTLKNIGVDSSLELQSTFNKVVAYFRAFEAKPLTHQTGNVYRDLCDSQAGVCRHRAFGFMITVNALGIPTRYVENEAHAFAEVWFPEVGWQRIDLGGAAVRFDINGMKDREPHRPRGDDPFAKPPEYTNNYSRLGGDVRGLTPEKLAEKRDPHSRPSGTFDGVGSGDADPQNGGSDPTIMPGSGLDNYAEDPKKQKPTLEITLADQSAYRGNSIHVEARVHVSGKPLADHPVTVFLAPRGSRGSSATSLGTAVTDADGMIRGDFQIPSSLSLATYEIYLSTPPDAFYNPATSY